VNPRLRSPWALLLCLGLINITLMPRASAAWSSAEREKALGFDRATRRYHDGSAATVWAAVRRKIRVTFQSRLPEVLLDSQSFEARKLPVALLWQENKSQKVRAPLAVVLPGVFGTIRDPVARTIVPYLVDSGYHVLVLNNSWSDMYQQYQPKSPPGSIEEEAEIILQMIRRVREQVGPNVMGSIHLVGVSYGGFLAHAVLAKDLNSGLPLIDGQLLALSPPVDFPYAVAQMDQGIARALVLASRCSGLSLLRDLFSYAWFDADEKTYAATHECADFILFGDFAEKLKTTIGAIQENPKWKSVFGELAPHQSLSFESFVRKVNFLDEAPHVPVQAPSAILEHWLSQLPECVREEKIRIFSAEDDFVNRPSAWRDLVLNRAIPPESLLVTKWGGHFGYTPRSEFEEILKSALKSGAEAANFPPCHKLKLKPQKPRTHSPSLAPRTTPSGTWK
jgi:hypothetical protein